MDLAFYVVTIFVSAYLFHKAYQNKHNARDVEIENKISEYLKNHAKFITIDKVDSNNETIFLAYNYLTNEYVIQGKSEDDIKEQLLLIWPSCDVYVVKIDEVTKEVTNS
jgi:hypothetical protein